MLDKFQELMETSKKSEKVLDSKLKYNGNNADDGGYWKPEIIDNKCNAIIRFLPPAKGDTEAFATIFKVFYEKNKKFYNELSLTSLGQKDPVYEYNSTLEKGSPDFIKRTPEHIAMILVKKHSNRPSDEGKVFPFSYGKMINNFITDARVTDDSNEDDEIIKKYKGNPFDPVTGADFYLKITPKTFDVKKGNKTEKVEKYTYENSQFIPNASPIFALEDGSPDKDKIIALWEQTPSIQELIKKMPFKTYDELKRKLEFVLSSGNGQNKTNEFDNFSADMSQNDLYADLNDGLPEFGKTGLQENTKIIDDWLSEFESPNTSQKTSSDTLFDDFDAEDVFK